MSINKYLFGIFGIIEPRRVELQVVPHGEKAQFIWAEHNGQVKNKRLLTSYSGLIRCFRLQMK